MIENDDSVVVVFGSMFQLYDCNLGLQLETGLRWMNVVLPQTAFLADELATFEVFDFGMQRCNLIFEIVPSGVLLRRRCFY